MRDYHFTPESYLSMMREAVPGYDRLQDETLAATGVGAKSVLERVPFIAVPMGTAMRTLGVDPPPSATPGPLSRPTPEALGGCSMAAGSPTSRSRRPRSASRGSPPKSSSPWSRTRSHRWSR
jgi:hypothetical protein